MPNYNNRRFRRQYLVKDASLDRRSFLFRGIFSGSVPVRYRNNKTKTTLRISTAISIYSYSKSIEYSHSA